MKRRVTVHFGDVRVVVPCRDENTTVADLAEAAIIRYKKATGKMECDIRIQRMQCISDEGILDMDDRIIDVFDDIRDQILAIYDEQSPNNSDVADGCVGVSAPRSAVVGRVRDSVVEIVSLDNPPSNGLRVSSSTTDTHQTASVVNVGEKERLHQQPVRSSLRSDSSTPTRHRVTLSPEVEKRLALSGEKDTRLSRTSARKSRLTDSFFDAKERLEDARETTSRASPSVTEKARPSRAYLKPALDPENTVIVFPSDDSVPMGIEVTGVQEDASSTNGRLSAVQILRIEPDGRVGLDGRLRVGDNIVEIDNRPVYQMSIVRARAYLSELQSKPEPSLTVSRPSSSFADGGTLARNQSATSSLHNRPILSALQQANTVHIGHTKTVELRKTPAGFGFTVTGRETAKGERLFYIGTVKPNGVALGHLRAGDRLLELNGEPTADLTQAEVVDRLKKAAVGETVTFLVSRVVEGDDEKRSNSSERENLPLTPLASSTKEDVENKKPEPTLLTPVQATSSGHPSMEELELVIPLNDTGSAGLGVSLKARVTVRTNGTRQDCGIFIKNVLHGGAAHKDGRLQVNDRIIGIEELRLDGETNATASEAVSRRLKAIGPSAKHVRLRIQRARNTVGVVGMGLVSSTAMSSSDETPARVSVTATESTSSEGKYSPSEGMDSDVGRLDESELTITADPFSREAPTRKSMSEKRGMGASSDPHHIKLFQGIKHQRQTSAPSHSEKRRSLSVESASRESRDGTRKSAMPYRGALTSDSFRQATDVYSESVYGTVGAIHPYPPGSPVMVKPRSASRDNKDKQRRKSMGGLTAMKSFLGLGGKNRDENPSPKMDLKHEEAYRLREEEEKRRIREHYERLREKEAEANRPSHSMTPGAPRRDTHRIYASPSYSQSPQFSSSSFDDPPLIVANSRFYCSLRARDPCRPAYPTTNPTTSSTDTKCIDTRPLNTGQPLARPESLPFITELSMRIHNRRPITTLFPAQSPTTEVRSVSEVYNTNRMPNVDRNMPQQQRRLRHNNHDQCPTPHLPTTTACSTHGSRTVAKQPLMPPSKPLTQAHFDRPLMSTCDQRPAQVEIPLRESCITPEHDENFHLTYIPPTTLNIRPENSTPTGARVSLRARKKMRRSGVRSEVVATSRDNLPHPPPLFLESVVREKMPCSPPTGSNTPSTLCSVESRQSTPQTLRTNSRVVTAIDDSVEAVELDLDRSTEMSAAFDYCRLWNEWNSKTGGSLPSRRSRQRPPFLNRRIFDAATDC
ncbi:hypothetical protein Q1695_015522 [Nippostrongylus brasiliensis]|nr:hypothetical protein Q1695_015522 [Nippostrongylus brasiliensis]